MPDDGGPTAATSVGDSEIDDEFDVLDDFESFEDDDFEDDTFEDDDADPGDDAGDDAGADRFQDDDFVFTSSINPSCCRGASTYAPAFDDRMTLKPSNSYRSPETFPCIQK